MAGSEIKVMWERILNYTITEQKTSNIHEFLKAHGYSSSLIRAIKEDPDSKLVAGSKKGACQYWFPVQTDSFRIFFDCPDQRRRISMSF